MYLFHVSNLQSLPIPHMINGLSEPRTITCYISRYHICAKQQGSFSTVTDTLSSTMYGLVGIILQLQTTCFVVVHTNNTLMNIYFMSCSTGMNLFQETK
jgi:hypothetical protein